MHRIIFFSLIVITLFSCSKAKIGVSDKTFPPISLVNHYKYYEGEHKFNQLGTAFLLKLGDDTFAITAKHTLRFVKPDSLQNLTLENCIKEWSMSPLGKEDEKVVVDKLLNEDKTEGLRGKNRFEKDWLVFSIKENNSKVKPLEFRDTPLKKGEKLYSIGWTRHMKEGKQRVYEFEYYKTKGTHLLMRNLIVPELMGGMSGGPVVDENGKLVGVVSKFEFIILAMEKMSSPVGIDDLRAFLESCQAVKTAK